MNDDQALRDFVAQYARPYDPESDDYDRPPFAADIKEGKNDPIYNAHSYHTKVPPRGIIPYILHYTSPGDLILDPFCGSGMTGVATQMCANPPADLLEQFPELKDRVGPRQVILNDLSPAACHIAYNYNTLVDVDALRREFERVKAAVKDEFDWLYGTEHYEPAVGLYDPANAEVGSQLKNPPGGGSRHTLFSGEERTWELLTKTEVEERLGYPVTELPCDKDWGDLDVAQVKQWVCIPATIQHTIWSDVYRCEGFVTIEEPTGKISTRGKNAGKPQLKRRKVLRGCGREIVLWNVAVDPNTGAVSEDFKCSYCGQGWQKLALEFQRSAPVEVTLSYSGCPSRSRKYARTPSVRELEHLDEIETHSIESWHPNEEIWAGRELMTMGANRKGIKTHADFYTKRNLHALSCLFLHVQVVSDFRLRSGLLFCFTAIVLKCSKLNRLRPSGAGDPLTGSLYVASLVREENVFTVWERRSKQLALFPWGLINNEVTVRIGSATEPISIPDASVDYVFADPPFGGNLYYADASLPWESWLEAFTDESKELVFNRQRFKDTGFKTLQYYAQGMAKAFQQIFRVLKPGRWCTVEFNNSDGVVFDAIKTAALASGFDIANMLLLDKKQKSFKQVKGAKGEEDVVDKDVVFNLYKPATIRLEVRAEDHDLEQQTADAVRQHLHALPERMKDDPAKYNDEHRTTATINSMLMNTLIPKGVNVDRLNLPFIERVCSRYFRKVGQRWYLRGEAVGSDGASDRLIQEEIAIKDEISAIEWLRQRVQGTPALIGELKPVWMKATGLLPPEISHTLVLEDLLLDNFWRDPDSNRWREPTDEEREHMNDDRSLRVLHDADRFVAGTLRRATTDAERCGWVEVLFKACEAVEDNEGTVLPTVRGFDPAEGYRLISRLFQSVLREHVSPTAYSRAQKQARVASQRMSRVSDARAQKTRAKRKKDAEPTLFDLLGEA